MTELRAVQMVSAPTLPTADGRPIVFHGANKTGSLAMADVMRQSYAAANRSSQFFSVYHAEPQSLEQLDHSLRHVSGHSFFVAHYLYKRLTMPANAVLVSQIRDPLPRTLSVYGWLKRNHLRRHASLDAFPALPVWLESTGGTKHTQMLQFAFGFPEAKSAQTTVQSHDELLDLAISNLRHDFAWFGCAELFEQSIFAMAHICGLPAVPTWRPDTRNRWKQQVQDIDPETIDLIREVFSHEFAFYEQALSILEKRLQAIDFGSSLDEYRSICAQKHAAFHAARQRNSIAEIERADRKRAHFSVVAGDLTARPGAAIPEGNGPPNETTMGLFYNRSPYQDFPAEEHEKDLQGWNSYANAFRDLIEEIKPRRIIEVGVWKGAASIHMANLVRELDLRCEVLCIDTWLGTPAYFLSDHAGQRYQSLRIRNGYPQLFYTFLTNVVCNGVSDYVVPLPMTSESAAAMLSRLALSADLIHVDAARDYSAAFRDFQAYWMLLSERGVLFGSDYLANDAVTRAADDFAEHVDRPICGYLPKFVIAKCPDVEFQVEIR